ncbi:MAG: RidA family protein [Bacteroidetes bacterium]|nr:RidA family protein [Clostridia bacterium]MQY77586.1 RidA family protein [Bacteroidota bacterium]
MMAISDINYKIINSAPRRKGVVVLRQVDDLLYLSGHGPEDEITGKPFYTGRLGESVTLEQGRDAARICGIILLGALQDYLGTLDKVDYIVKAFALVSSAPDFYNQEEVMDGFSDLMVEVFGDRGIHARSAMGTSNLPAGNIPVEIEIIVKVVA